MTAKEIGYYSRVLLNFVRKNPVELCSFSRNVVSKTAESGNYPTPSPTLASISAAVEDLDTKAQLALSGDRDQINDSKVAQALLVNLMRQLADYVNGHCQSDDYILQSSGFDAVKTPSPIGILPAPLNLRTSYTGMSGEVLLKLDPNKKASGYVVQRQEQPDGPWISESLSTSSRKILVGFIPGKVYRLRASAEATAGSSEWSVPTEFMAL